MNRQPKTPSSHGAAELFTVAVVETALHAVLAVLVELTASHGLSSGRCHHTCTRAVPAPKAAMGPAG